MSSLKIILNSNLDSTKPLTLDESELVIIYTIQKILHKILFFTNDKCFFYPEFEKHSGDKAFSNQPIPVSDRKCIEFLHLKIYKILKTLQGECGEDDTKRTKIEYFLDYLHSVDRTEKMVSIMKRYHEANDYSF
jgi:hypothetical protein